jgi:hypothetical protein
MALTTADKKLITEMIMRGMETVKGRPEGPPDYEIWSVAIAAEPAKYLRGIQWLTISSYLSVDENGVSNITYQADMQGIDGWCKFYFPPNNQIFLDEFKRIQNTEMLTRTVILYRIEEKGALTIQHMSVR